MLGGAEGSIKSGLLEISSSEEDMKAARKMANRLIDLLEKEGIEPNKHVLLAMLLLATEHAPSEEEEKEEASKPTADAEGNLLRDPATGKPIFMAPGPKMMQ